MLNMLEPMMLPRASWPFFLAAATTQVASSGREVPPARIVIAMNLSLTFSILAMISAELTKSLPPMIRAANPAAMRRRDQPIFLSFTSSDEDSGAS